MDWKDAGHRTRRHLKTMTHFRHLRPTSSTLFLAGIGLLAACSSEQSGSMNDGSGGQVGQAGSAGNSAGSAGSGQNAGAGGTGGIAEGTAGAGAAGAAGTAGEAAGGQSGGGNGGAGPSGQTPGSLTFQKQVIHQVELAESACIGDLNNDGANDIASGRRWWEGPDFTVEHTFRAGHEELPPEEPDDGVSDDWADYIYDVNGDGWQDILIIASPDTTEGIGGMPITGGEGYWYENPGMQVSEMWTPHLISADIRMEQRMLLDINDDGYLDLLAGSIDAGHTKGFFELDPANPTAEWSFTAVTREYDFYGNGWIHAIGAGDVDGDGKLDLLERAGYWLQRDGGNWEFVNVAFSEPENLGTDGNVGGAHMYAYDVDGDSDADVITSLNSHGWGLAWFEQTAPGQFEKHLIVHTPDDAAMYNDIAFSQIHAVVLEDMDGDGLKDIVTGKGWYVHPPVFNDPDYDGTPVLYVFKLVRDAGGAHFEPHLVDSEVGTGRQFQVGHLDNNGTMDFVIGGKKGLFVFRQDPATP